MTKNNFNKVCELLVDWLAAQNYLVDDVSMDEITEEMTDYIWETFIVNRSPTD